MGFNSSSSQGNYGQGASPDKVMPGWYFQDILHNITEGNKIGDYGAVIRFIKQMHHSLIGWWDEEYSQFHGDVEKHAAQQKKDNPGMRNIGFDYDMSLIILSAQFRLMSRATLLPQRDFESIVGEDNFLEQVAVKQEIKRDVIEAPTQAQIAPTLVVQ